MLEGKNFFKKNREYRGVLLRGKTKKTHRKGNNMMRHCYGGVASHPPSTKAEGKGEGGLESEESEANLSREEEEEVEETRPC